jgi:hypothetical protein
LIGGQVMTERTLHRQEFDDERVLNGCEEVELIEHLLAGE